MPIEAKIVDGAKNVKTVTLPDDPSDREMIDAIGGGPGVDIHHLSQSGDYEVLRLTGGVDKLVIGKAPQISAPVKKRITCTISDAHAVNLAASFS
ncbi:hypothetical protein [Rhizobium sp. NXC24]|uniref:hypothetical protein n=1 Tax=Rhizobium sp. NXC24 TaxID=2048897 RepID=UPI000CF1E31C|nr:hypothetical protein [Rhizobium sp. NXC24]